MIDRIRASERFARLNRGGYLGQFVKYAMVGMLNVGLFLAIFNGLSLAADLPPVVRYVIAFLATSVNSFFLNKRWAFRDIRDHAVSRQYLTFLFFTMIGLALNTGAFSLFLIPLRQYGAIGENAAVLCALPLSVMWNFTSYRLWTFRHHSHAVRAVPDSAGVS